MNITRQLLTLSAASLSLAALAQGPVADASYRVGKLDNGLTYYIRHNAKEPGLADFYIAQRVGSILEEPRQRGLAHFLEHMAFNGTRHFRGDSTSMGIVPWCESIGVKFGANLNAYTSVDQTVYNISAVPMKREGIIDSTLLILADWSHDLLLTDKEIDKERGVIHEEWRTRRAGMASQRMIERIMPVIYKGTKYEDCLPIGSMDIVDNFPYNDLRDYYHKWYRPDLQAIVVVGDVDVDAIERKIRATFSPIPAKQNAAERVYYPVNDNAEMIVAVDRDSEQPMMLATLYMKRDATPDALKHTDAVRKADYVDRLVQAMLNERLHALQDLPTPPVHSATARISNFFVSRTKEAFSLAFGVRQEDIKGSFMAALGVVERARQTGFSADELARAKALLMKGAERKATEADNRVNKYFVSRAVNHFLASSPLVDDHAALADQKRWDAEVTVADVNRAVREAVTNKNEVLTVMAPDKADFIVPTEAEMKAFIAEARSKRYEQAADEKLSTTLMAKLPKAGKIKKEQAGPHGSTVMTLSNGMTVVVKPTELDRDNIMLTMWAPDGQLNFCQKQEPSLRFITTAMAKQGVAGYSATTLDKMLAGKNVRLRPSLGNDSHGWSGATTKADLETLLQLLHLSITESRADSMAFEGEMDRMKSFLTNRDANPQVAYNDSLRAILYDHHPRMAPTTQDMIARVSYKKIKHFEEKLFSGVSGDTLMLLGNLDMKQLRPLLCRYVASLPVKKSSAGHSHKAPLVRQGDEAIVFRKKMNTPSALVNIFYTYDAPYSAKTDLEIDMLARVLQIAYTDSIREEKGGTYGVSVQGSLDKDEEPNSLLKIAFRTDPSKYEELIPIVYAQLDHIAANGPLASSIDKVKRYLKKAYEQNVVSNGYWQYVLENQLRNGIDFDNGYVALVDSITAADLQRLAASILQQKRRIEVTMLPEE